MKKIIIFLLSLLLFLLLGQYLIYHLLAPSIEADIKDKVKQSLMINDLPAIEVAVDGREVTLKGEVSSDALKAKALRVAQLDSTHFVQSEIKVIDQKDTPAAPISSSPLLTIEIKDNHRITLNGFVPDLKTKNNIASLVSQQYKTKNITNNLLIKETAPKDLGNLFSKIFNTFKWLKQGVLKVEDQQLSLSGLTSDLASREKINTHLKQNLPKQYQGNIKLKVALGNKQTNPSSILKPSAEKLTVAESCQTQFNALLSKYKINFKTGSATLETSSFNLLKQLKDISEKCSTQTLFIAGHTDAEGSEESNKTLSLKRAESVVTYLKKAGVRNKLIAKGYGEEKPLSTNDTPKGRASNRRIEFTVEGLK